MKNTAMCDSHFLVNLERHLKEYECSKKFFHTFIVHRSLRNLVGTYLLSNAFLTKN